MHSLVTETPQLEEIVNLINDFYKVEDDFIFYAFEYIQKYEDYNARVNRDIDYLKKKIKDAIIKGTQNE